MTEEVKVTESRPVQDIVVPVIQIGDSSKMPSGTIATTRDPYQPNFITQAITPLAAIAVRFGYEWCTSFAGSMLAGGITSRVLPHADLMTMLTAAVILATSIAGVGMVRNFGTLFSGLEKKFPLASGSI